VKPVNLYQGESSEELRRKLITLMDDIYGRFNQVQDNVMDFNTNQVFQQPVSVSVDADEVDTDVVGHESTYDHSKLHTQNTDTQLDSGVVTVDGSDNTNIGDGGTTNYVQISSTGDVVFVGAAGLAFGEIYVQGNSTADTVATATNTQVTRFDTNGVSNNMTPDHTNDHITVTKAGMYLCTISFSFSGSGSVDWTFSLYKNNGNTEFPNVHTNRKLGAAGDVGSASMSGIVDLAVNDTIELWMQHAAGVNKDITMQDCTLSLIQIGGT